MTQNEARPWYIRGSLVLSLAAVGLSAVALYRLGQHESTRDREEFRNLIVNLRKSTLQSGQPEGDAAVSWIYYDAARRLEREIPDEVGVVDYLVLVNFTLGHSDINGGKLFVEKAVSRIETTSPSTTLCLAYMALGHIHFEHFPKTDLETARNFYGRALAQVEELPGEKMYFIESNIRREWALDEYSVGNESDGDEQAAQARDLLLGQSLPERYLKNWDTQLEEEVIEAKVRGGLL